MLFRSWLCSAMGGRAAEQLVFDHLTTGAASDLENATALARRMVCELGMSDNLGPLTFGKKEEMVFLGREIATHKDYSEQTAEQLDKEVRAIAEGAYNRALTLLRENGDKLQLVATTLLEREVLDGEEEVVHRDPERDRQIALHLGRVVRHEVRALRIGNERADPGEQLRARQELLAEGRLRPVEWRNREESSPGVPGEHARQQVQVVVDHVQAPNLGG